MRIDRLDLYAYGPFTLKSLNLADGNAGLHLIYGDNEAGKSTSLRALIAWLFGIPTRTKDNFLHSNSQLRIGGKLRLSNGNEFEFFRRKGTKGTLLAVGTDEVLDDSLLWPYLPGGIDQKLFTNLYGIDHGRLVDGSQELLNQSGDLGQALFSAAVGTTNLRGILAELQSGAAELFKPRASKMLVNRAIAGFKEAQKRIRDSSLPVAEWKRLRKELADTLFEIDEIEKEIEAKNKEKSRLDRHNRVKGALAERKVQLDRIKEFEEVLLLPENFGEKCKTARDSLQTAREAKKRAEAKLLRLKEESDSLNVRNEFLANEDAILAIYRGLGAVEKAIQDRPMQDGKRRSFRNEAESLLKCVRPDRDLDGADSMRPLLNNKRLISGLSQEYELLNQKKEKAKTDLRNHEDKQKKIKEELGDLPQPKWDLNELKATITIARKAGDLEERLADIQKRAAEEEANCEHEFAKLGRFSGTAEMLSCMAVPVNETLDRFEKQSEDLVNKIRDFGNKKQEVLAEQKQAERDLKALLSTADIPTITRLEESRGSRNTAWKLIKNKYIEKVDIEKDIAVFAAGSELPVLYEQKVGEADHLADQLRLAADQVVKRADLEAKIENLNSRLNDIVEETRTVNEDQRVHKEKWRTIWEPLGIDTGTPREMKQWILRVEKLLENVRSANKITADANKLAETRKNLRASLALQIAKIDEPIDCQELSLEAMISLCDQRVEQGEADLERLRQLNRSLSDTEFEAKRTREEIKQIEIKRSNWRQEWGRAIAELGLEPDAHPEQVTETFDQFVMFFEKLDKSEDLRKRIYGIDQVARTFEQRVFEFADGIGFNREGQEATTLAARLNRDLNEAREARASQKKIEGQSREIKSEIEDADITIQTAQETLALLREQALVNNHEDLILAAEGSKNKRDLQKKIDQLEQELIRNGDGLSIENLEKEANDLDIDAIEGDIQSISSALKELATSRDDLRDRRQKLKDEIEAKDGQSAAAEASENAEQQLATLVSGVEQYLRLKIAALLLEHRIEDYRKKNQTPVLARAGALFSRLTQGSFANLRDELDARGKPILLGVRQNDKEVSIGEMSDGTRDQLYLSLRLATLEQHLSKGEPMPFVVDDILISFDDNRTMVCIEVLAELATRTQVLLFTHHRRVLELGEKLKEKKEIYIHELA